MVDLTPIITAVLTLIISLISAFLIPYIKAKTTDEQFNTIKLWVPVSYTHLTLPTNSLV